MRKTFVALLLLALGTAVQAEIRLREGHPQQYSVARGDTLWDISARFLQQPWQWPQVWAVNPQVRNPHLIYPGDVLNLVYLDGQPRIVLQRGESRGTVRLSPQVRREALAEAIPTIPLGKINSFLLSNRIVDDAAELERAPYILAGNAERVVSGAGDRIYARGDFAAGPAVYGLFRRGKVYSDPKSGEVLGINLDDIGSAEVVARKDDIATLRLTRTTQEVRLADRLLPTEARQISSTFMPAAPVEAIDGLILDVPRGVTQVGLLDVVTLDKGRRDGLDEGHVLAVYKTGETVRDRVTGERIKVPDERAGLLMVFRSYDKLSYGLVLMAQRQLAVGDKIRNP